MTSPLAAVGRRGVGQPSRAGVPLLSSRPAATASPAWMPMATPPPAATPPAAASTSASSPTAMSWRVPDVAEEAERSSCGSDNAMLRRGRCEIY